ncbi:Os01g0218150 [Oryza sativa Japonica Group]|uniref:Os01g0218150 protein n=1 Tax=Oryza sativa subsp. japonica TaxID=39947 RepID=A0A0P0V069_ORYSJ|nr:Os01g0218150 [Oryza sativa Japonica Group]
MSQTRTCKIQTRTRKPARRTHRGKQGRVVADSSKTKGPAPKNASEMAKIEGAEASNPDHKKSRAAMSFACLLPGRVKQ